MNKSLKAKLCLFGFLSGFSLHLGGYTLNFWLASIGVDITTIGLFSILAFPYAIKYVIALFIDKFPLRFKAFSFGKLRSYIFLSQFCLAAFLGVLSQSDPVNNINFVAILGLIITLFSAMQDVSLSAFRIEILQDKLHKHGPGTAYYNFGYRVGMMISGAGAISLSEIFNWQQIYLALALSIVPISIFTLYVTRNDELKEAIINRLDENKTFWNQILAFIKPVLAITSKKNILIIFSFLFLYRIADNCIYVMSNPFLLQIGFSALEIASVVKVIGLFGSIAGGFFGGYLIEKQKNNFAHSIKWALFGFGILHNLTHIFYILQAQVGYDLNLLKLLIFSESFTGGMAMTAYIAYMSSLCKQPFIATQYAALSSIMGLSRAILPAFSGFIVESLNWTNFFTFMFAISFAGLFLVPRLFIRK